MATPSASASFVNSLDAKIGLTRFGAGQINTILAACGDASLFSQVSFPYAMMDLRGQGRSTIERNAIENLALEDYMSDFDAVFGSMKVRAGKGGNLMGYSQGGFFTAHYAASHPDTVNKLVLIEPALYTDREDLMRRAELAERGDGTEAVAAMIRYVDPATAHNRSRAQATVKSIVSNAQNAKLIANHFRVRANNPITERHLQMLKMPVLLIAGTDSHVKDMVARAACEIPDASVWYVRGASHLDLMTAKYAKAVGPVVESFLAA